MLPAFACVPGRVVFRLLGSLSRLLCARCRAGRDIVARICQPVHAVLSTRDMAADGICSLVNQHGRRYTRLCHCHANSIRRSDSQAARERGEGLEANLSGQHVKQQFRGGASDHLPSAGPERPRRQRQIARANCHARFRARREVQ